LSFLSKETYDRVIAVKRIGSVLFCNLRSAECAAPDVQVVEKTFVEDVCDLLNTWFEN